MIQEGVSTPVVDSNNLTDRTIGALSSLTELELGTFGIANELLSRMTSLLALKLFNNRTVLDSGIRELTNLTCLGLNEKISDDGISNLVNLTSLVANKYTRKMEFRV